MENTVTNEYSTSAADLNLLRTKTIESWLTTQNLDVEDGWSISNADINELLAHYPLLHLKTGYKAVGFQFREAESGNGLVLGLTSGQDSNEILSGIEEEIKHNKSNHLMSYMEGDDSPFSYLSASVLYRELLEFGAFGHGVFWTDLNLLDNALSNENKDFISFLGEAFSLDLEKMVWYEPKPLDFTPKVEIGEKSITVTFYTYEGRSAKLLRSHRDTYQRNNYVPVVEVKVLARG